MVISPTVSEDSVEKNCPYFPACGGCDWIGQDYQQQLTWKNNYCQNLFGCFNIKKQDGVIASPEIYYYRNKMDFVITDNKGKLAIGLRTKGNFNKIVPIEECKIFMPNLKEITEPILSWAGEEGFTTYNSRTHRGQLRYLCLRHAKTTGEVMAVLVMALDEKDFKQQQNKFQRLTRIIRDKNIIDSFYICFNTGKADISLTDKLYLVFGKPYLKEILNGIVYYLSPNTFLQSNTFCCSLLYELICRVSQCDNRSVLDLFCGSGGISLQLALKAKEVLGVDNSPSNVTLAKENAAFNKLTNVSFICTDANEFMKRSEPINYDILVLDPPRMQLSKDFVNMLTNCKIQRIIYVSCNPYNAYYDLKQLTTSYYLEQVIPVDMFVHTRHLEVILVLSRQALSG